jgi:hypothetical protein
MNSGIGRLIARSRTWSRERDGDDGGRTVDPQTTTFTRVRVRLQDFPDTADLSRLIEYLSRVGRATRIGRAPTGMRFNVSAPSGVDVQAVLEDLGVPTIPFRARRS